MKLVFISDDGCHHKKIQIKPWLHIIIPFLIISSIFVIAMMFSLSFLSSSDKSKPYADFNSVINKLGSLEAEAQRINALSTYIASKSKIDINKFALNDSPARGGADKSNKNHFGSTIVRKPQLVKNVKSVERNLAKQKLKLKNLLANLEIKEAEESLANLRSKLTKASKTADIAYNFSKPLNKGYISSAYGSRRDPINGSLRHHGGLDIAARKGTPVFAVANGFITFRGKRGAYGNLLEINHSESLKSRYAHLDSMLVKKGQLVRKGDLIGTVGATGRVTGPHLHLEIKEHGKIIDPNVYLKKALKSL